MLRARPGGVRVLAALGLETNSGSKLVCSVRVRQRQRMVRLTDALVECAELQHRFQPTNKS